MKAQDTQALARFKRRIEQQQKVCAGGAESARQQTKKTSTDGFNIGVIILNVYKITSKKADTQTPTNIVVYVRPFTKEHIQSLDQRFYRWNDAEGCAELAVQKVHDTETSKKARSIADHYDLSKPLVWAKIKPGEIVALADFTNASVKPSDNLCLAKIIDLVPRMRKPPEKKSEDAAAAAIAAANPEIAASIAAEKAREAAALAKEDKVAWSWRWSQIACDPTRRLSLKAMACLKDHFSVESFFFQDQRFKQTNQSAAILNVVPIWDERSWVAAYESGTYSMGNWIKADDGPEAWASSPEDLKIGEKSVVLPNAKATDKTSWRVKQHRNVVRVEQAINGKVQRVLVTFTMNSSHIEANYKVRDMGIWYYVMRFIVPYIPFMAFCNINDLATKKEAINQNHELAGTWHDPNEDVDMKDENEGGNGGGDGGEEGAEHAEGASQGGGGGGDEEDAAALRAAMAATTAAASSGATASRVRVDADFGVVAYCNSLIFNTADAYRKHLFQVSAGWPLKLIKGRFQPYTRKEKNPSDKFETWDDKLDLNFPKDLPEVFCVSEYLAEDNKANLDLLQKLTKLVKDGKGEFRVAVNSPDYANPAIAAGVFHLCAHGTAEQNEEFLETGEVKLGAGTPDERKINWTPVPMETRRYALYYINKLVGLDLEAEKDKAREALSTGVPIPKPPAAAAAAAAAAAQAGVSASPGAGRAPMQITHEPTAAQLPVMPMSGMAKAPAGSVSSPQPHQEEHKQATSTVEEVNSDGEAVNKEDASEAAHEEQSSSKRARKDKSTKKHHKHRE